MNRASSPSTGRRASSETLGVAVLIGMTLLVTAGLGLGVLVISEDEQQKSADIDFTFLGDTLVVVYQDETERVAGNLYIQGPANNVSWAELDDRVGPEGMVGPGTDVRLNANTAYGAQPSEDQFFEIIYFDENGERFVLASVNEGESNTGTPAGPEEPDGSPGPDGPGV